MISPVRIAHRGASGAGLAPENTLAAFEKAIQIGVDAVEIDVHATRDGQVVVLHDASLERTTNGQGTVGELTLAQVRQADAGSWHGKEFSGERVPTLQEVLELTRHRALVLVEIKADFIAERVLQIITELQAEDQVVIQSFNPQTVQRIKLLDPGMPAALLVGELSTPSSDSQVGELVRKVLQVGAHALSIWHGALNPAVLEGMRRRGISVWTWTVDEEIAMRDLVQAGVGGIITNYPDRLNRVLSELFS